MLDLIKYIVGQFAEDTENVEYLVNEKDRAIEVTVVLSPSDMGCFFVSPHHPTPKPTLFTTLLSKKVCFPTLKLFESVATFNKIRGKI